MGDFKPLIFLTEQKGNKLFDYVNFTRENPQYLRAFQPSGKESTRICVCNQKLNVKTTNKVTHINKCLHLQEHRGPI